MQYQLTDLVDADFLQRMINRFSDLTRVATAILDINDVLVAHSRLQSICTDFYCRCPAIGQRCQMSGPCIKKLAGQQPYSTCQCLTGLTCYAAVLAIDGHRLGTIIAGPIFHDDSERQRFIQQARESGFDEELFLQALEQVTIVSPQQMEKTIMLVTDMTRVLAQISLERKQRLEAEKEIAASAARLKLIFESSNDGFWTWDEVNSYIMSDRCAEIMEFPKDEYDPVHWVSRIHPEDVDRVLDHMKDHLAGHADHISIEYRVQTWQGKWKWINVKARVISYNDSGYPSQVAGMVSDISERKQFEAELLEREYLYRSLVETSPSTIVLTDVNGIIKFINRQGAELSGWHDPDKLVGQSGYVLLHAKEWGRVSIDYHLAMVTGKDHHGEYCCVRRDGSSIQAELNIAPLYAGAHKLAGCITMAQDITARKAMESELLQHRNHLQKLVEQNTKALRLSEEKFAKAFTASPVAMSIATLEEGRYVEVNDAFCSLMGYSREEIIGKTSLVIWNCPENRQYFKQLIKEHGLIKDHEFNFITRSGEVRIGLLSGQYIQLGEDTFILSSVNDITEQRRIDREMERLDRMNLIGEMAASIGHEIRNPMTTVRGLLQILSSNELYVQEQELFQLMIEELDRANFIITEFLSLAKDKHVELLPSNLSKIVESVIPLIQANALSQEIHVDFQLNPVPDLLLDSKEIRQLIFNLTQNGLEAMQKDDTLILRTYAENGQVILMVQDQGPGIDNNVLDKLGIPFVTTKVNGTGLGLSVCYRIAARHNAVIEVDTSPEGTIFWVRFPLQ